MAPPTSNSPIKGRRVRCDQCYVRKLKCDLVKPSCSSCRHLSLGERCKYPDQFESSLRFENSKTAHRVQTLWRQRSAVAVGRVTARSEQNHSKTKKKYRNEKHCGQSDEKKVTFCPTHTNHVTFRKMPNTSALAFHPLQVQALERLVLEFCQHELGVKGMALNRWLQAFHMLPVSYASYPADSAISLSVSALALANLSKGGAATTEGHSNDLQSTALCLAWDSYGRAISLLNKDLRAANRQSLEQTLFVIWVLGLFEMIDSRGGVGPRENWTVHVRGASALLRSQSYLTNDTEMGTVMIDQVFVQILFINLLNFEPPGLPLSMFAAGGERGHPSANLVCKMYRTAEICSDLADAVHKMQHSLRRALYARLGQLIHVGFALDNDLQQCTLDFPSLENGEVMGNKGQRRPHLRPTEDTDLNQPQKLRGEEEDSKSRHIHGYQRDMIPRSIYLSLQLQLQYTLLSAIKALSDSPFEQEYKSLNLKGDASALQEELLNSICDVARNICLAAGTILDSGLAEILKGMYTLYPLRVFAMVMHGNQDIIDLLEKQDPGLTQWGSQLLRLSRMKVSMRYAERPR